MTSSIYSVRARGNRRKYPTVTRSFAIVSSAFYNPLWCKSYYQ